MIDLWESLLRTASALAIVLVLMGLLALAARRVMGNRLGGLVGARPLVRILASGYVGPRKSIALVSVAGEYLIVGTTATDLVPLGRVTDAAKVQELLAASPVDPAGPPARMPSWWHDLRTAWMPDKEHHGDR